MRAGFFAALSRDNRKGQEADPGQHERSDQHQGGLRVGGIEKPKGHRNRHVEGEIRDDIEIAAQRGGSVGARDGTVEPIEQPVGDDQHQPDWKLTKGNRASARQPEHETEERQHVCRHAARRQRTSDAIQRRVDQRAQLGVEHRSASFQLIPR